MQRDAPSTKQLLSQVTMNVVSVISARTQPDQVKYS